MSVHTKMPPIEDEISGVTLLWVPSPTRRSGQTCRASRPGPSRSRRILLADLFADLPAATWPGQIRCGVLGGKAGLTQTQLAQMTGTLGDGAQ